MDENRTIDQDRIMKINIEEEMKSSYIDYSMSVIVARALPDVRDGFKPCTGVSSMVCLDWATLVINLTRNARVSWVRCWVSIILMATFRSMVPSCVWARTGTCAIRL